MIKESKQTVPASYDDEKIKEEALSLPKIQEKIKGKKIIKVIDSCWGFLGDYRSSGLIKQAKDSIDYYIKKERKKKLAEHKENVYQALLQNIKDNKFEKRILAEKLANWK